MAGVATWLQRGFDLGEKVVYIDTNDGEVKILRSTLADRGVDLVEAIEAGRLEIFRHYRLHDPQAPAVLAARSRAEGYPALRVSLGPTDDWPPEAYRRLEGIMARLCDTDRVSALCQCPLPETRGRRLREAVALHADGVREDTLATAWANDSLVLRGELDMTNATVFGEVLIAMFHSHPAHLELDLRQVSFLDAASCRILILSTYDYRTAGGALTLRSPQPIVDRVLSIFGVHELPGFAVTHGRR